MKTLSFSILALLFLSSCNNNPTVIIETNVGNIKVEIFEKEAPITASNFLAHCEAGTYNNAIFYRVVNDDNQANSKILIDVIQGGLFHDSIVDAIPAIPHETTEQTGIKHLNGTISMARMGPGTASSEFFICVGAQPELNYNGKRNPDEQGFAAFGKVVEGMDVVLKIHKMDNTNQYLNEPVKMKVTLNE